MDNSLCGVASQTSQGVVSQTTKGVVSQTTKEVAQVDPAHCANRPDGGRADQNCTDQVSSTSVRSHPLDNLPSRGKFLTEHPPLSTRASGAEVLVKPTFEWQRLPSGRYRIPVVEEDEDEPVEVKTTQPAQSCPVKRADVEGLVLNLDAARQRGRETPPDPVVEFLVDLYKEDQTNQPLPSVQIPNLMRGAVDHWSEATVYAANTARYWACFVNYRIAGMLNWRWSDNQTKIACFNKVLKWVKDLRIDDLEDNSSQQISLVLNICAAIVHQDYEHQEDPDFGGELHDNDSLCTRSLESVYEDINMDTMINILHGPARRFWNQQHYYPSYMWVETNNALSHLIHTRPDLMVMFVNMRQKVRQEEQIPLLLELFRALCSGATNCYPEPVEAERPIEDLMFLLQIFNQDLPMSLLWWPENWHSGRSCEGADMDLLWRNFNWICAHTTADTFKRLLLNCSNYNRSLLWRTRREYWNLMYWWRICKDREAHKNTRSMISQLLKDLHPPAKVRWSPYMAGPTTRPFNRHGVHVGGMYGRNTLLPQSGIDEDACQRIQDEITPKSECQHKRKKNPFADPKKSEKHKDQVRKQRRDHKLQRAMALSPRARPQSGISPQCGIPDFSVNVRMDPQLQTMAQITMNRLAGSANALAESVNTFSQSMERTTERAVTGTRSTMTNLLWQLPLVICACMAIFSGNRFAWIATAAVAFLRATQCDEKVVSALGDLLEGRRTIQGQSGLGEVTSYGMGAALLSSLLIFNRKEESFISISLDCLTKKVIPMVGNQARTWSMVLEWAIDTAEILVNKAIQFLKPGSPHVQFRSKLAHDVEKWLDRFRDVHTRYETGRLSNDKNLANLMVGLCVEGNDIYKRYKTDPRASKLISEALRELNNLCNIYAPIINRQRMTRPEPVCLGLFSPPGVGKSLLAQLGVFYVNRHFHDTEEDAKANIWSKNKTSNYWESYHGQFAFVMDDFAQRKSVAGSSCVDDYNLLVDVVNCWPMPLDMAALEHKGRWFFNSPFVCVTSNIKTLRNAEGLMEDTGAVARRIHHSYWLTLKDEWALNGKLNHPKWLKACQERRGDPEWDYFCPWVCKAHDLETGQLKPDVPDKPLREVLDEVVADLKSRFDNSAELDSVCQDMFRALEERGAVVSSPKKPAPAQPIVVEPQSGIGELISTTWAKLEELNAPMRNYLFGPPTSPFISPTEQIQRADIANLVADEEYLAERQEVWQDCQDHVDWLKYNLEAHPHNERAATSALLTSMNMVIMNLNDSVSAWVGSLTGIAMSTVLAGLLSIAGLFVAVRTFQAVRGLFKAGQRAGGACMRKAIRTKWYQRKSNRVHDVEDPEIPEEPRVVPQSSIWSDQVSSIRQNLLHVTVLPKEQEPPMPVGSILMVSGNLGLMPRHFRADLAKIQDRKLHFNCLYNPHLSFSIDIPTFLRNPSCDIPNQDLTLIKIPNINSFRSIINRFCKLEDIKKTNTYMACLEVVRPVGQRGNSCEVTSTHGRATKLSEVLVGKDSLGDHQWKLTHAVRFEPGNTRKGDCGAVLLNTAPSWSSTPIMGMHTCGNDDMSIQSCVWRETIEAACEQLDPHHVRDQVQSNHIVRQSGVQLPAPGTFVPLGVSTIKHVSPPFSKLQRTSFYGRLGDQGKAPAKLAKFTTPSGEVINPITKALEAYGGAIYAYDDLEVRQAVRVALRPFFEASRGMRRAVVPFEVAVAGVEGVVSGLPRRTSPGYPYNCLKYSNKKAFFGLEGDYQFDSPECVSLREQVQRVEEDAKCGIQHDHIWTDFPKDELRPIEKVLAGKTRLISACPLVYAVLFRQYFLDFMVAMTETRVTNGVAVGVNPYSEWGRVANHLRMQGEHVIAGDFSRFDASEQAQIHLAILEQINDWYGPDEDPLNKRVRSILWKEVVASKHIGGKEILKDTIYQWTHSLPSGHPATSIINSIYNLSLFVLCYKRITGSFDKFWQLVSPIVYGDDNVVNIHPSIIGVYNQHTITKTMGELGMEYTDELKLSGGVPPSRKLEDVTFLKRGFRQENVEFEGPSDWRWLAPLALDTVKYVTYWCRDKERVREIAATNLEFCLEELAMHPQEVWEEWAPKIHSVARELEFFPMQPVDRRAYLHTVLERVMPY